MRRFLNLLFVLSFSVLLLGCQEPQAGETVKLTGKADTIIIDNTCKVFKTEGYWDMAWTDKDYKDYSIWTSADTQVTAEAIWTPDIQVTGNYEVFEWHGDDPNYDHASNAPLTINYSGGSKTVVVNQQENIGKWNSVGTYKFAKGTKGNIVLTNKANGNVIADAIKLIRR